MPSFLLEAFKRRIMAKKRKRRQRKRKLKEKHHVDWSSLPQGTLEIIAGKLPLIDCLSISEVCKSWNAVLGEELPCRRSHGFPWLIVSGQHQKEIRTCVSILDNRVWELKLSEAYGKYCWGSFHEWLIMVKDLDSFFLEVNLLNPFSKRQINLPSIWNFYHKMVLSGLPFENDFVCMLLHSHHRELAFWIPGAQSWHKHKLTGEPFEDAVFCNGSFFLLDEKFNIWQINAKSIRSSISNDDVSLGTFPCLEIQFRQIKMPEMLQFNQAMILDRHADNRTLRYLVESRGDILLVCRVFNPLQDLMLETQNFEVYSLDLSQSSWERVVDLRDQMLFLGKCCSSSYSAEELGVGISNNIYFTNDPAAPWWNEWDSDHLRDISTRLGLVKAGGRNWGIFRLPHNDGEPFSFLGDIDRWAYTWFTAPTWWCCKNMPSSEKS